MVSNTGGRRTANGEEGSSGQCLRLERALATNKLQSWAGPARGLEAGGRGPRTWAARSGPATPAQDGRFFLPFIFVTPRFRFANNRTISTAARMGVVFSRPFLTLMG